MAYYDSDNSIHEEYNVNDDNKAGLTEDSSGGAIGIFQTLFSFFTSEEFTSNMLKSNYWILLLTDYAKTFVTYLVFLLIFIGIILIFRAYLAKKRRKEISFTDGG